MDDELHAALADRLIKLSKSRGWSLSELARQVGCSKAQLSRVTKCLSSPTVGFLSRVAGALDVSVASLLR